MAAHKFRIGQPVTYRPDRSTFPVRCTVVALVPTPAGAECAYRIRIPGQSHDLVVTERKLREVL